MILPDCQVHGAENCTCPAYLVAMGQLDWMMEETLAQGARLRDAAGKPEC